MQVSQGLLSGPLINGQMFVDAPEDFCCEALGNDCCLLPVMWGLSDKPYPKGVEVEQGNVEIPAELQALMSALQQHVMASDEPMTEVDAEPVAESQGASEPESAKPVQSPQAEQQVQRAEPAKTVAAMAPMDLDALMKLQGVAWGNDGKPVKVSLGDK